ncbi:J domain-containing protein [Paraburkholderia aspalathi]|uniref:J domain-containing protein n=1 Tax=Paraburkholderia aspalathi TaxID=1324617 RepID=UPI003555E00E
MRGKCVSLDEYYRRLKLPDTASPADVKRAYRRLRAKYHPDRNTEVYPHLWQGRQSHAAGVVNCARWC